MSKEPKAYSTDDPTAVAAFTAARDASVAFARKVVADAEALGKNKGALRTSTGSDGGYETIGIAPDDPDDPPEGWVYSKAREALVPRRGKAGESARKWLAEHQPPKETRIRAVMAEHGLPVNDMHGDGRFGLPAIGVHDGVLWALYLGTPGLWFAGDKQPEITWTPRKLSEYYAAHEASEAQVAA